MAAADDDGYNKEYWPWEGYAPNEAQDAALWRQRCAVQGALAGVHGRRHTAGEEHLLPAEVFAHSDPLVCE